MKEVEDEGAEGGSRFMSSMVSTARFCLFFITLEDFLGKDCCTLLFLFYMYSYLG